jgi:hemolysin III
MTTAELRQQTLGEEIANSLSHGAGFVLAIVGVTFALPLYRPELDVSVRLGVMVYGVTMTLLYLTSALYHGWREGPVKRALMKLDYCVIYLFIAGTYTPFSLGVLHGPWGWFLLTAIWTLAIAGAVLRGADRLSHPYLSTALYLVMGWLVVVAAVPLVERMPAVGLAWLLAGGLAYTVGVTFYLLDNRLKFAHLVWHLFVLAGSGCHFVAVLRYA